MGRPILCALGLLALAACSARPAAEAPAGASVDPAAAGSTQRSTADAAPDQPPAAMATTKKK